MIGKGGYGRFGVLSRQDLERYCYLDDEDRRLIAARRRDYNRLGFAVQVVTVRNVGMLLTDPLDVPSELVGYLAEQLGIEDPSCVKRYTDRDKTRLEHAWEIQREYGIQAFSDVAAELVAWIADQAWTTGDGPKATFAGAIDWLRSRNALLPGITTLEELVAEGRRAADERLWAQVADQVGPAAVAALLRLLEVPADSKARVSELERLRKGTFHASWRGVNKALDRLADVEAIGMGSVDLSMVPPRRLTGLATYGLAANSVLVDAQAGIDLARAWGDGLVASIDGMRFVVPVRTHHARPNPKYFGRRSGITWLNMLNDQSAGLAARVVSGTPRDSLNMIDVVFSQRGGRTPEVIITDSGSYSDIVFGLLHLLGFSYRPQLANLPDQRLWRIDTRADYGPLNTAARGVIDLDKIATHWDDMCRVAVSINTGEVSAHEVTRMISRDGRPTALGEAIAGYGRIFKTLHILRLADDEPYRREGKRQSNLTEGRHDLARAVYHGRKGELHEAYYEGMEDQLSALGLILNCVALWNTVYLNHALGVLREQSYPVLDADTERLSAFIRSHLGLDGHYSFVLPELGGRVRPLRDPDAPGQE
ncbi:Tn3 family transposase [Nocardia fusca]|uniref:Tn3 family transposase n=1 Tax=Nocardia fusca TaxID=941183 RepID=UPI0037CB8A0B